MHGNPDAAPTPAGAASGILRPWSRPLRALAIALAASAALLLVLPGFRIAYVFDDYDFLGRAQAFKWTHLLPSSSDIFYRPVSRELYFGFLQAVSPGNPMAGHAINAALLVAIVILGGSLVSRIAGPRAGAIAAILIATFGQWPVLVAWVSGSQDLFAITFLLLALHLELSRARVEALLLFVLAILSKETAVVVAPAIAAIPWLDRGSRRDSLVAAAQLAALLVVWSLIHPGIRSLVAHGGFSSHGGYVGVDNPSRWDAIAQSLTVAFNIPITGFPTVWPGNMSNVLVLAGVPFVGLLWLLKRTARVAPSVAEPIALADEPAAPAWRAQRSLLFGALIGGPPLLLTCLLVKHWVPYYVCLPAVGLAVALSPRMATMRPRTLFIWLSLYLVLGFWSRGIEMNPGVPTERGLVPAGQALRELEANFKRVAPALPRGAMVYVSTMATGTQSVYLHLHAFQVLRVWYGDPTIQTFRPEQRVLSSAPEYLFWIDPELHVFQVDVRSLSTLSAGAPMQASRYRSTLRSYAIGLAGSGEISRAVDILLHLDDPSTGDHAVNYRLAAMLLYWTGDDSTADGMLRGIPAIPANFAVQAVGSMLTVPTPASHPIEQAAFRAFGLSWDDAKTLRALMGALVRLGYQDAAERLARRILVLQPGDEEAAQVMAGARNRP